MIAFPSALMTHYNIHLSDFELVSTPRGEAPTRANSTPDTRGSIVFYSSASIIYGGERDTARRNKEEAEARGVEFAENAFRPEKMKRDRSAAVG